MAPAGALVYAGVVQRKVEVAKRSVAVRAVVLCGSVAAALGAAACTFYTGCPDPPANSGTGNTNAGGSSSNGGKSPGTGGNGTGDTGAGGDAPNALKAWEEAAGSLEGRTAGCGVIYIANHPTEDQLFVGIDGFGVWQSKEPDEWVALGTSGMSAVISNGVNCLAFDPEDPQVFWEAGMYNGPGGFRTDDGGKTFVQLTTLKHVDSIAIDFTDPKRKTLISGPHEKTTLVFKSSDGGQTWADVANLPAGFGFSSNVIVLDADTYLVGMTNGIVRTTDGGDSWDIVSHIGGYQAPLQASDGSIYWNAEGNQGVVRSTDGGETWERIVGGGVIDTSRPLVELPGGRIAGIQARRVVISEDQGFSWTVVSEEVPFTIKGFIYAPTRKGFFVTTDSCDVPIPGNAILKLPFDYETE